LRDNLAALATAFLLAACVSNTMDVPNVAAGAASDGRVFVLASGSRAYPDAARGYWQLAAQLAADLEGAGFDPTIILDAEAAPLETPIIDSIDLPGECFSEPLLTVLSAGVIPHFGCVEYGHRFRLRCSKSDSSIAVNASFTVRSYVGWLVWPLALLPDWAWDNEGPPSRRPEELALLRERLQEALASGCAA